MSQSRLRVGSSFPRRITTESRPRVGSRDQPRSQSRASSAATVQSPGPGDEEESTACLRLLLSDHDTPPTYNNTTCQQLPANRNTISLINEALR